MKKRRNHSDSSAWMTLPLYIFTIVFVVCPLIYMVVLSFATPSRGFGVTWKFTLDNYRNILEPVYLNTFVESLKLAFTSTIVIALIGYPFGYFMARLPEHRKKKRDSVVYAFLGKFPDPSVWLDHYSTEKRTFELCINETWDY